MNTDKEMTEVNEELELAALQARAEDLGMLVLSEEEHNELIKALKTLKKVEL